MTVVLEVTQEPGLVPVKMVKGDSLTFNIQLAAGVDPPLSQVYAAIYENTPAGFAATTPALVLTLTKPGTGNFRVNVTSAQSNTLSITKSYRWFFRRSASPDDTRALTAGPWRVVAP